MLDFLQKQLEQRLRRREKQHEMVLRGAGCRIRFDIGDGYGG
jgi:hypothetical protein